MAAKPRIMTALKVLNRRKENVVMIDNSRLDFEKWLSLMKDSTQKNNNESIRILKRIICSDNNGDWIQLL